MVSVRRDFYFSDALASNYIRITPQHSFVSGSQQFGFNQISNSYAIPTRTGASILYNNDRLTFDNKICFQPISLTGFLKTGWTKGKFFIQPQLMINYYIPASSENVSTAFLVNAGFVF